MFGSQLLPREKQHFELVANSSDATNLLGEVIHRLARGWRAILNFEKALLVFDHDLALTHEAAIGIDMGEFDAPLKQGRSKEKATMAFVRAKASAHQDKHPTRNLGGGEESIESLLVSGFVPDRLVIGFTVGGSGWFAVAKPANSIAHPNVFESGFGDKVIEKWPPKFHPILAAGAAADID